MFLVDAEQKEDLIHLAEYVSLTLRKSGVATLFPSKKKSKTIEEWFQFYDLMAVPFVVVLEPAMLHDSILGLRSRETTLQVRCIFNTIQFYTFVEYFMRGCFYRFILGQVQYNFLITL